MQVYQKIIDLFEQHGCKNYAVKEHDNEGYGTNVAKIHSLDEKFGAKALVIKLTYAADKTGPEYCLAILSFQDKLDLTAIKNHFKAKKISMATKEKSLELTSCESGAIPPFSFDEALPVIIDKKIEQFPKIFFNAGRLDRSVSLAVSDYLRMAAANKHYQMTSISQTIAASVFSASTPNEAKMAVKAETAASPKRNI